MQTTLSSESSSLSSVAFAQFSSSRGRGCGCGENRRLLPDSGNGRPRAVAAKNRWYLGLYDTVHQFTPLYRAFPCVAIGQDRCATRSRETCHAECLLKRHPDRRCHRSRRPEVLTELPRGTRSRSRSGARHRFASRVALHSNFIAPPKGCPPCGAENRGCRHRCKHRSRRLPASDLTTPSPYGN